MIFNKYILKVFNLLVLLLKKSQSNRQREALDDPMRSKQETYTTKRVRPRPEKKRQRQEFTTLKPETQHLVNEELFDDFVTTSSPPIGEEETESSENIEGEKSTEKGFLDFMPLDIMKKVHLILKSQDPTVVGKMRFLKSFQRILYNEIGEFFLSVFYLLELEKLICFLLFLFIR